MKTTIAATLALAALARPAIAADAVAIAPLSPEARTAMTGKSWRQGWCASRSAAILYGKAPGPGLALA